MRKFNKKFAMTLTLCLAYLGLTACGTKGPLYIPEQRYPQQEGAQSSPQPNNPAATTPTKEY